MPTSLAVDWFGANAGLVADALVVVALVGFYAGLSHDLAATADFLDARLGVGFSLGAYVATGVAGLLALATVAVAADGAAATAVALGLAGPFAAAYAVFFRVGTAVYGGLLRVGLELSSFSRP